MYNGIENCSIADPGSIFQSSMTMAGVRSWQSRRAHPVKELSRKRLLCGSEVPLQNPEFGPVWFERRALWKQYSTLRIWKRSSAASNRLDVISPIARHTALSNGGS